MKPSELLLKAAMNLERNHNTSEIKYGCCDHIYRACPGRLAGDFWEAKTYFCNYLSPHTRDSAAVYWYGNPDVTPRTNVRVLALLFASAIAESEGK